MKTEVLWNNNPKADFLADLKSFAASLDFYRIVWDLEQFDKNKYLRIKNGEYKVLSEQEPESFQCPVCKNSAFEIMEGEFQNKPVLGLCCLNCESYGAVFPNGL